MRSMFKHYVLRGATAGCVATLGAMYWYAYSQATVRPSLITFLAVGLLVVFYFLMLMIMVD